MTRRAAILVLAALAFAAPALAGVRVVEDEVVFSLRAPGAEQVYLVGDFNNWNPTVEPMEKDGDRFEIWLFLVEGTYRYKFVVDGEWIVDPDNPGDREKGSYLTLEERAGGYALGTDEPEPERVVPAVTPGVRYIGQFRWDDGDADAGQIVDLTLAFERPHLRGRVDLQSFDHSWKWSPLSVDIDVSGALVEVSSGPWSVRGFEYDSTWTSRDPTTMVGRDGVFDYNAGFDRHGISAELRPSEAILVRALVADQIADDIDSPPPIDRQTIATFGAGSRADTTVYEFAGGTGDADQVAFEAVLDTRDFEAGYVKRTDRGMRPGTLVDVTRDASSLPAFVYATRENRSASLYWLRLKDIAGFAVDAGYGRGWSDVRLTRRGRVDALGAGSISAAGAVEEADASIRIVESNRAIVSLERSLAGMLWRLGWDYMDFDFDSRVYPAASAGVHRAGASVTWQDAAWTAVLDLRYTDADYGDTPGELHVDSPVRNVWVYGRDELRVGDIVSLDQDRYADAHARLEWTAGDATPAWAPRLAVLDARAAASGAFEAIELVETRATLRFEYREHYYASGDGRVASYDKVEWSASDTFASGWVELGYRRGAIDVNLGYGFDPVIFDPVPNDYNGIGRERWLLGAVASGVRRDAGRESGANLLLLERMLEATNTVKLECVVTF